MPRTTRSLPVLILVIALFGHLSLSLVPFSKLTKLSGKRFPYPSSTFWGVVDVVCCHKCQTKDGCIAVNVNVDRTCEVIWEKDTVQGAVTEYSPGWTLYYLHNPVVCLAFWTEYNGGCYIIQAALMTWDDADDGCAALHSSATLTDIKTSGQKQFIEELIANTSEPENHWIGGGVNNQGSWVWRDSSPFADGYTNWGPNQPEINTEYCVTLLYDDANRWHDSTCAYIRKSICKYEM